MTDKQWILLKTVVQGEKSEEPVVGFIIDSPWLPGWFGIKAFISTLKQA